MIRKFLKTIGNDNRGATAVEYGLIVSVIVLAVTGAIQAVANANTSQWSTVSNETADVMENLNFGE
jgi:pilus assembly protein Flp/PilA